MGRIRLEERLARSGATELEEARHHLEVLVSAAQGLVATCAHDPDRGDCGSAGCALRAHPDGPALCAIAHRLGGLHAPRHAAVAASDVEEAARRFRAALTQALDAVRACRQTAHPSGHCWFTVVPGVDGCGDVLRLAHRLS